MSSILSDKAMGIKLSNALDKARTASSSSIERLSSGQVFSSAEPQVTDRALADRLENRLRGLSTSKRNINDAVSMLQTAESGFTEVGNMLQRMKELNTAAATSTLSEVERKYLFIEYDALHKEIDRISKTTEFSGIPLLDGQNEKTPDRLIFRVDSAVQGDDGAGDSGDWNELRLENLKDIVVTTLGLGLRSANPLLALADGIDIESAQEMMEPNDTRFTNIYDEALDKLSHYRALFGSMQTRLSKALSYNDVATENVAAAKSKIADVDYASEVSKLTQSNILLQAGTALLSQNNIAAGTALHLIESLIS